MEKSNYSNSQPRSKVSPPSRTKFYLFKNGKKAKQPSIVDSGRLSPEKFSSDILDKKVKKARVGGIKNWIDKQFYNKSMFQKVKKVQKYNFQGRTKRKMEEEFSDSDNSDSSSGYYNLATEIYKPKEK